MKIKVIFLIGLIREESRLIYVKHDKSNINHNYPVWVCLLIVCSLHFKILVYFYYCKKVN